MTERRSSPETGHYRKHLLREINMNNSVRLVVFRGLVFLFFFLNVREEGHSEKGNTG